MKKSVALAIAAAMSLSVAGTALAANPFSDVPQGHWAYDAIAQLEKDGLVTGYGDGTYRGDRAMSRYEMATIVAQLDDANGANTEMINRLRSEFATELYNLGVRVDKLEKNASTIKFTGDARIRYQKNTGTVDLVAIKDKSRNSHRFEQRVRINMDANINENVKFKGRVNYTNVSNYTSIDYHARDYVDRASWSRDVWLDRAEIQWRSGSFEGRFGRITPIIGQGLIWYDNPADGALIGYKTDKWDIFAGVLDYSPMLGENIFKYGHGDGKSVNSVNATVANIGYKFNNNFSMTAAYSNMHRDYAADDYTWYEVPTFELMAFGFNAKFGSKWGLVGEYIKNNADNLYYSDDDGYWVRAKYGKDDMNKKGSFSIYAEYLDFGPGSIDAFAYGHILDTPGSNWYGDGAKGYGIGITYVPAKNINMQFIFHDLKTAYPRTRDNCKDYRNSYQFITNFKF